MDPRSFLAVVLPSTGIYCVCELSSTPPRHRFTRDLDDAVIKADAFAAAGLNTYFALASYERDEEGGMRRLAKNARLMRSFFIDLDISATGLSKTGKRIYTSKKEAITALYEFLQESGLGVLGQPWLVDSGGGVHAYWPLDEDVEIDRWQPVAERLKRTAAKHSLHIDMSVTADVARVLRMPGTMNVKYDPPKPSLVKQAGDIFDIEDIDLLLPQLSELGQFAPLNGHSHAITPRQADALMLPGKRPVAPPAASPAVGKAMVGHIDSSFQKILDRSLAGDGCAQVAFYANNASDDGMEPMWRAMMSLAKCTTEGEEAGRQLANMHPYDEVRFQKKWAELKGPLGCSAIEAINPGGCAGCPHAGKITNPLPLGRAYAPQVTPATATAPALPAPPKNFVFKDGKTCVIITGGDGPETKPILNCVLYLHSVMQEDTGYTARFCWLASDTETHFIPIPTQALAKADDALKALAKMLIFPIDGAKNAAHLFNYLQSCVRDASAANTAVRVPAKYGWQPDNSFAFGNRVISAAGEYTFVSDRLNNLIAGMQPSGTFAGWQRVMDMLINKGTYDIITLGLIGFASPLMHWNASGAEAMVIHATSRASGVGKSLALSLGRSVWGGRRINVVPKTSENTMLQRAALLGGLPLLVDEVTSKNRNAEMEWIPAYILDYSQGQHKLKGSSSANAELNNDMMWSGLSLITSNSPVLEHMLGARETTSNGEVQRFFEWRTETPLDFTEEERNVLQTLDANSGHAGPAFARWLVKNMDAAKDVFAKTMANWRKQIGATDAERFWVAGGTALISAAILLGPKYANICTINTKRVVEFLMGLVLNARRMIASNVSTASDLISSFLREYNGMLIKVGRAGAGALSALGGAQQYTLPESTRGRIVGRVEIGMTVGRIDTYIDANMLKKYCSTRNWGYMELCTELAHNASVKEKVINLSKDTQMTATNTRCLHISYASSDAAIQI